VHRLLLTLLIVISICPGAAAAETPSDEITIAIVGDILLTDAVVGGRGADYPWAMVAPLLRGADLAIGNLETAVSLRGAPVAGKQFTFRSRPGALAGAANAGIDVVTLANNHSRDYGPQALLDTIAHVRAAGMQPVGAGRDADEAIRPVMLDARGLKVAVLAFTRVIPDAAWVAGYQTPGLASGWDPQPVLEAIRKARSAADVVVVLTHWGEEMKDHPRPTDAELAGPMLDAGATVVAGHHPHVLQGFRRRGAGLVAFSLGNFIFTTSTNPLARETGVLTVTLGRRGVTRARFTPLVLVNGQPRPAARADARRILARLARLSRPWETRVSPTGAITGAPAPFPPQ